MKKTLTAVLLTTGLILGGAQSASAGIIVTNPRGLTVNDVKNHAKTITFCF